MKAVRILTVNTPDLQGCMHNDNFHLRMIVDIPFPKQFEEYDINDNSFIYELTSYIESTFDLFVHNIKIVEVDDDAFNTVFEKRNGNEGVYSGYIYNKQ